MSDKQTAVIVGAGSGLSRALAERCAADGMQVALAARDADKLSDLAAAISGRAYACDAASPKQVKTLFESIDEDFGSPDLVIFNASFRTRGPLVDLDPAEVENALLVTCYAGFLVGQQAAKRMLRVKRGTILFTGASASVKGYANSAPFAMGKFGLRGLAQSMARELHPQNVHVGHVVIDGGIDGPKHAGGRGEDGLLDPAAIAETYLQLHRQHRSAWAWEIELRPWAEKF
ncbi:MAG: SDR family NAD(P)-dependent oxidoreductase [Rhodospirillales bacterium]|nr:SDR family NAD(P)-dependent oxidoreductase [Rhodospirillales bacterium]